MKSLLLISVLMAFTIGLPAAQASEQGSTATGNPEMGATTIINLNATVTAVNLETREVTLRGEMGNEMTIKAGDQVQNLAQLKVGDQVDVAYYESVDIEVLGPAQTGPQAAEIGALETAAPGEKPGGVMERTISVVATIEAMDKDRETVTLKGPAGNTKTVKVHNPANLEKVAVGDMILIKLSQSVAVDVTAASANE
jgi:hypothetical protein